MKTRSTILDAIASAPVLAAGAKHPALEHVQRLLAGFGYMESASVTGILDDRTSTALREYQRLNGIPQSGILDVETRDRLSRRRCGLRDSIGAIAFTAVVAWDRLELTFAFGAGTEDINVPGDSEFEAVRNAFRTWAATGYFSFREVLRDQNPNILIGWLSPTDIDWQCPEFQPVAYGTYPDGSRPGCFQNPGGGGPLLLHFNDDINWSLHAVPPYTVDVETIALHEIGHCLGLAHSAVPGAVMNVDITGADKRSLHPDDLAGIAALYGSKDAKPLACVLVFQVRHHFGNEPSLLPGVFAGQSQDFLFDCPGIDVNAEAVLTFQARHVSNEQNILTVNGETIYGGLPVTSGDDAWAAQTLLISGGSLKPTNNKLRVESRTGNGETSGDIDDFVLDNMTVWYRILERGRVITLP